MPYLILNKDSKDYKVYRFLTDVSMGRSDNNDIVMNDLEVSRHHAHIAYEDGSYILFDQSVNGTFVNDSRIERHYLSHTTVFRIWDYWLTFIDDSTAVSIDQKAAEKWKTSSLENDRAGSDTLVTIVGAIFEDEDHVLKDRLLREGIVVESEKMLRLYQDVQAIARINVPVLIVGEAGTGKEHIAHALHHLSSARGNFIPLNCSSIPEGLFESELFGCVKGAFSSAVDKPGKLELANGGTIFLDEIGDMNLSLQPKLLRFIEDRKVTRLGDTREKEVDARVIAATNKDLLAMINGEVFREDFYQRLACIKLEAPPLRERITDIPPMIDYFISKFSNDYNWKVPQISVNALKMLTEYQWPGNVRELKNVILNVLVHTQGKSKIIYPKDVSAVSENLRVFKAKTVKPLLSLEDIEKKHISEILDQVGWNKTEASKILGISRDTLYKKMAKYGISEK